MQVASSAGGCVPPKRRLKLDVLHGVISQKMILFTVSPVIFVCCEENIWTQERESNGRQEKIA
jgi:hypothetical protein